MLRTTTRTRWGGLFIGMALAATLMSGCKSSGSTASSASPVASATVSNGVALAANGCPTSNTVTLAKTKFAFHAGLTFGTFHRYLYKPFKAGGFSSGAKGRVAAFVKAGATALFDKRELRLATDDVKANPALCRAIAAPLRRLADDLASVAGKVTHGDTDGLDDANTQIASIAGSSSRAGTPITETADEHATG